MERAFNLHNGRKPAVVLLASAILILALIPLVPSPAHSTNGSWNPKISCSPIVVRITDITANQTQQASFNASPFTPGITTTVTNGAAKRWLTPGSTPPGWQAPGPSCTVTNSKGTISLFVEIDGVGRNDLTNEDWSNLYDPTNGGTSHSATTGDTTFNLFDPLVVPHYFTSCTSASDQTCYGRIHAEIDHDWQAAGYCGTGTACDNSTLASQTTTATTMLDVQGFVSWDPGNLNAAWHQFNGWEIHPLTGWRIHQAPLNVGLSYTPASPVASQSVTFTGTASGGTSPYTFSWNFGDGATGSGNPASHTYTTANSYTVHLYVTDSRGATGSGSTTVSVSPGPSPDFSISTNPSTLTIQSGSRGTSTVNLSSLNGFSGSVLLSASASPSGLFASLNPTSVSLSWGGSGSSILTVGSSTVGSYTVTVAGTSGSLSHSTTITVDVANSSDFQISVSPSSMTVQAGASSTTAVNVSPLNGFTGTVILTATGPDGLSLSLNPSSVTGSGTLTLTISAGSTISPGSYTVTVVGTSGSLSHYTTITVAITPPPDFGISANPASLAIASGSSGASTINLSSLYGYTGTVSLTATVSTNSLTLDYPSATLSPASLSLSSGGTATSTLTVKTSLLTLPGTYYVTITATDGTITHTVTVTVTVTLLLGL